MRLSDGSERRRSERTTITSYAGEIKIFRLKKNSSNGTIMYFVSCIKERIGGIFYE